MMNKRMIIGLVAFLASVAAFAQAQNVNHSSGNNKHNRFIRVGLPDKIWVNSTPVEMYINGQRCSLQFSSINRLVLLTLNCGFHPCLLLDAGSEILFLLQDSSTAIAMSQGRQSGGLENPPPCKICGTKEWPYQYSYTFSMDTNTIRKLTKSGVISTRLVAAGGQCFNLQVVNDGETDEIRKCATVFLNEYISHFKSCGFNKSPLKALLGKWKLIKAEGKGKTLVPKEYTWMLTISSSSVSYSVECNGCIADIISSDDSLITIAPFNCTEMCCHGWDSISNYVDYNGKYKVIDDSVLIIINKRGRLYLSKVRDENPILRTPPVPSNQTPYNGNVQHKAEFPGDENKWIADHIHYPDSAKNAHIEGIVYLYFDVDTAGVISHPRLIRGVSANLDREAMRIISTMPKWKPAMQDGKHIKVYDYALVHFEIKQ